MASVEVLLERRFLRPRLELALERKEGSLCVGFESLLDTVLGLGDCERGRPTVAVVDHLRALRGMISPASEEES